MKYPSWLPYPKAWGQAIALSIQLFVQGIPLWIVGRFVIEDFRKALKTNQLAHEDVILALIIVLIAIIIYITLFIYLLSLIHQLLWDEPHPKVPKWFPRWRCWGEGIWNFCVIVISTVLGLVIASIYYNTFDQNIEQALITLSIAEIVIMAYCFHFRNLISRKFSKAPKRQKQKINIEAKTVDPIEEELNNIKAEFGLKQMNDVKKKTN